LPHKLIQVSIGVLASAAVTSAARARLVGGDRFVGDEQPVERRCDRELTLGLHERLLIGGPNSAGRSTLLDRAVGTLSEGLRRRLAPSRSSPVNTTCCCGTSRPTTCRSPRSRK
jgi:hypothetical protein